LLAELTIFLERPGVNVVDIPVMGGRGVVRFAVAATLLALLSAGRLRGLRCLRLLQVRPQRGHQGLAALHLRLPVVSLQCQLLRVLCEFLVAEPHLVNLHVLLPEPPRQAFLNCSK